MVMESVNDRTVPSSTFVHGGTGEPSLRTLHFPSDSYYMAIMTLDNDRLDDLEMRFENIVTW